MRGLFFAIRSARPRGILPAGWSALLGLFLLGVSAMAAEPAPAPGHPGWLTIEEEVAAATRGPQVTVVHFWAPWCGNSKAELAHRKWSTFLDLNRDVTFVFITVRSPDDGKALLAENGIGPQPNLILRHHPNQVRRGDGVMTTFMDLPVDWLPTTWVFQDGKLRFALNFGEVRFPLLQQLIRDAGDKWER